MVEAYERRIQALAYEADILFKSNSELRHQAKVIEQPINFRLIQ